MYSTGTWGGSRVIRGYLAPQSQKRLSDLALRMAIEQWPSQSTDLELSSPCSRRVRVIVWRPLRRSFAWQPPHLARIRAVRSVDLRQPQQHGSQTKTRPPPPPLGSVPAAPHSPLHSPGLCFCRRPSAGLQDVRRGESGPHLARPPRPSNTRKVCKEENCAVANPTSIRTCRIPSKWPS